MTGTHRQDAKISSTPVGLPKWRLYFELARLHKFPAGSILVFWPCAWGLTMAAYRSRMPAAELLVKLAVYFVGSTLAHNGACIVNDICDIDFDRQVERTKTRPLASGAISLTDAVIFLLLHLIACAWMISWGNSVTQAFALFGLFPLHALYPLMKRWTDWPQAWLGLAMNWGFTVAWTGETGHMDLSLFMPLIIGSSCWTIVYDTIYACQDKEDDRKAGVKSTALLFGSKVRPILSCFATIFIGCLSRIGVVNKHSTLFFIISIVGAAMHLIWQLLTVNVDNPADCWGKFKANGDTGLIVWAGILADYILMRWQYHSHE